MQTEKPRRFAALAAPPYRFLGLTDEPFQACPGAPILPGSSCDYCGQGIRYVCRFKGSDGRTFKVGCDCAQRTEDAGGAIVPEDAEARAARLAKSELDRKARAAKAAKRAEKKAAGRAAERDEAEAAVRDERVAAYLRSLPHPHPGMAQSGHARLEWAQYLCFTLRAHGKVLEFIRGMYANHPEPTAAEERAYETA